MLVWHSRSDHTVPPAFTEETRHEAEAQCPVDAHPGRRARTGAAACDRGEGGERHRSRRGKSLRAAKSVCAAIRRDERADEFRQSLRAAEPLRTAEVSLSPRRRARAGYAAAAQIAAWAQAGTSAPARLPGTAEGFAEWAQYPRPEALDPVSGWRFFYHAHAVRERLRAEHGHFHVFAPGPDGRGSFTHLIGISVDVQGLPIRLFTTNRWVTDESWQPAAAIERHAVRPRLAGASPGDVSRWLEHLVVLFAPDIVALLRARDARMGPGIVPGDRRLEDRRLRIPSQKRVSLAGALRRLAAT